MKPIDKFEFKNMHGVCMQTPYPSYVSLALHEVGDKLNQIISSHNELIKIIESFYKEKVIYCIDDKLNKE